MIEQANAAARRLAFLRATHAGYSRTWERDHDEAIAKAWHVRRDADAKGDAAAADVADQAAREAEEFRTKIEQAASATTTKDKP